MNIFNDFDFWMKVYKSSVATEDYPDDLFTIIEMSDQEYFESFDCSVSDNDDFRVMDFAGERIFIYVFTIEQESKIIFYFTMEDVFSFRMTVEAVEGYPVEYASQKNLSDANAYIIGNHLYNIDGPMKAGKLMAGIDDQYDEELAIEHLAILKLAI